MTGVFGGFGRYGTTYNFHTTAQSWAGVANVDSSIYPLEFTNAGTITFEYNCSSDVDVRFRFERSPYPHTEPSYNTSAVTCNGSGTAQISVPSQGTNTFRSFLLYLDTRNKDIVINNIKIYDDDSE